MKPLKTLLAKIREVHCIVLDRSIEAEYLKAKKIHDKALWDKWFGDPKNKVVMESCSIGIWGRIKFV